MLYRDRIDGRKHARSGARATIRRYHERGDLPAYLRNPAAVNPMQAIMKGFTNALSRNRNSRTGIARSQ